MTHNQELFFGVPITGEVAPQGVDLDGTYDYFSRTSDLVGNVDSKTFTFSAWVYNSGSATTKSIVSSGSLSFDINIDSTNILTILARNSSNTNILLAETSVQAIPVNTFINIIMSIDLANTSNRSVYINDRLITMSWSAYTNDFINFTNTTHLVGSGYYPYFKGRLSNLFLDYTYRDLSIEANRRLFITADGKPADGQSLVATNTYDEKLDSVTTHYGNYIQATGTYYFYINTNVIKRINMSTPFKIATGVEDKTYSFSATDARGVTFKPDGMKFYIADNGNDKIWQYTMTTAWDISTATQSGISNVSPASLSPSSMTFNPTGTVLYVFDMFTDAMYQVALSTAYDITTMGTITSYDWGTSLETSIFWNANGTKYYSCGTNIIYEFNVSTPYSITTSSFSASLIDLSTLGLPAISQLTASPDGLHIFYCYTTDSTVRHLKTNIPFNYSALYRVTNASGTPTAPILYLPMKDAATAHINEGTGGNFTPNGTFATSNRGANQDNCVASYFDGVADYLSRTSLTGIADGKQFTFSCHYSYKEATQGSIFSIDDGSTNNGVQVYIRQPSLNYITIFLRNSSNTTVCSFNINTTTELNRNTHISVSVDTATSSIKAVLDGVVVTPTSISITADGIVDFTQGFYNIAKALASYYQQCNIGELYFNTVYMPLDVSNPFWDAVENKPIPVRKVIANTGVTPLIAMPLDASNAGKNYGTGGDFTANSGPYVGARGASEFWARSAVFGSTSANNVSISSLGTSTSKILSLMIVWYNGTNNLNLYNQGGDALGTFTDDIQNRLVDSSGAWCFRHADIQALQNSWNTMLLCLDLTDTNKTYMYLNGIQKTLTIYNFVNTSIGWGRSFKVGGGLNVSATYVSDQYINFSQEINRLKFVDGLGMPLDLSKQIESGAIPKPLFYLPFDDPSNLGKDASGNNNHFTINGTVTQGADVNG